MLELIDNVGDFAGRDGAQVLTRMPFLTIEQDMRCHQRREHFVAEFAAELVAQILISLVTRGTG